MIIKNSIDKKGQVWIETVIYTLVGIALIALVLAILTPKIKEFRDRSVIEQTMESMNVFDSKIIDVLDAPGNKRKVTFGLDRGIFMVDSKNNSIKYTLDESDVRYSEPGVPIDIGRIQVITTELNEKYRINLTTYYTYNITFDGKDDSLKQFTPASIPYEFYIENKGVVTVATPSAYSYVWVDITQGN